MTVIPSAKALFPNKVTLAVPGSGAWTPPGAGSPPGPLRQSGDEGASGRALRDWREQM